jgi:hypothetical protein
MYIVSRSLTYVKYRVYLNLCHKLFLGIPLPPSKQKSSYQLVSKSEQVRSRHVVHA